MDKVFGVTMWSIENRFATLQLARGLEDQKNYAAKIRSERGQLDIVAFVAFHLSYRNEETTTSFRYIDHINDFLASWGDLKGVDHYLRYRLTNVYPAALADKLTLLRIEATASVIDYYDTFIRVGIDSLADDAESEGSQRFTRAFRELQRHIQDHRIEKALFVTEPQRNFSWRFWDSDHQIRDRYFLGEHSQEDREHPAVSSEVWLAQAEMAVSASAHFDAKTDPHPAVRNIVKLAARSILSRDADFNSSLTRLLKLALNCRLLQLSSTLEDFIWREFSPNPNEITKASNLQFMSVAELNPLSMRLFGKTQTRERFSEIVHEAFGNTPTVLTADRRSNLSTEWLGEHPEGTKPTGETTDSIEDQIVSAIDRGDFPTALVLSRSQELTEGTPFQRRKALRYEAYSLLQLDRFEDLLKLIVHHCIGDVKWLHGLPLASVIQWLDKTNRKRLAAEIEVPIAFDLYSREVNDDLDNVRSYAYEDFLIARKLERPSELATEMDCHDSRLLTYYLRHLCVPSVMQVSAAFGGTKELQDERLAVTSLLVRLDSEHADEYEAEIREIARAQLIQRGVRHVEQSKIFVDLAAIRRWADKNHREDFERYQALLRAGINDEGAFVEAVRDSVSSKVPLPSEFLELPKNEANDLLVKLVSGVFRECLTNQEAGLDCYLSMRIRHGTLSGQLRAPLEMENVITQRDETHVYRPNKFWLRKFDDCDLSTKDRLDARLRAFSAEYDALIDRIADELIQVRGSEKPKGIFDLRVTTVQLRILASNVGEGTTFEAFLDRCFEMFWDAVDVNLLEMRDTLDLEIKPIVNENFARLQSDLIELTRDTQISDLNRAIGTAQTGAQQALDRVKDWFRLSQAIEPPQFTFEEMLEVGLQCVRTIHPSFDPRITKSIARLPKFADSLTLFSDIFFIVFDNIRSHSGLGDRPRIWIEAGQTQDKLHVRIRNEVKAESKDDALAELSKIRTKIESGEYLKAISSEGGTGLIKIRKIIGAEKRKARRYDFGFDAENSFFVDFELPTREISL